MVSHKKTKENAPRKTCAECIHEHACQRWAQMACIHNMDACSEYETVKDSGVYYIGFLDGQKAQKDEYSKRGIENMKDYFKMPMVEARRKG